MKIFLISLTVTFMAVVIPHFGIKSSLVSPKVQKSRPAADIFDSIKPKLKITENNFRLSKDLIPQVLAGSKYDNAAAYALVDFDTGKVIASKNISQRIPMASLTKLMTAVVVLDLASPDEQIRISESAAAQPPTKVMLKAGEKYLLNNLLQAMLISSANDSAKAIADGIDAKYGGKIFIRAMNEKAEILGLNNTNFTNTAGFDGPDHYSSAEDLSILSRYALTKYPLIARIVAKELEDLTNNGSDKRFYLQNWNGLLGVYPGIKGVKIGNTENAGNCTIVLSERNGKKIMAVILGTPGVLQRDLWAAELLDLGFAKIAGLPPVAVSEETLKAKYASWKYLQ